MAVTTNEKDIIIKNIQRFTGRNPLTGKSRVVSPNNYIDAQIYMDTIEDMVDRGFDIVEVSADNTVYQIDTGSLIFKRNSDKVTIKIDQVSQDMIDKVKKIKKLRS